VKRKSKVTKITPVDDSNQVLSLEGVGGFRTRVCLGCPWRVANDGEFPADAFVASAVTAYDAAPNMFGCHESGKDAALTCAGFLLRNSRHNLGVRMALGSGRLNFAHVQEPGEELHESYREMAVANGVPADHPALDKCRADDE
jgi:hypothetical protein